VSSDAFAHETAVAVRHRDLDPYDHVNNAVYATYLERARLSYRDRVLGTDAESESRGFVVASLEIDYRRPITRDDDPVTVAARVPELGTTSFPLRYEIRTDDGVAATGETTQVVIDPDAGDPAPIPGRWRSRIAEFEGLDAA